MKYDYLPNLIVFVAVLAFAFSAFRSTEKKISGIKHSRQKYLAHVDSLTAEPAPMKRKKAKRGL